MEGDRSELVQAVRRGLIDKLSPEARHRANQIDHDAVLRYLNARDDDVKAAVSLGVYVEEWRHAVKPELVTPADISSALPSGCWRFAGQAHDGRPIILIQVGLWRPSEYSVDEFVRYVAYMVERNLTERLPPGVNKHVVLFDLAGFSLYHNNMRMIQKLIEINQKVYCDRLSIAVVFNAPGPFLWAWTVIQGWIDPKTREKVHLFSGSKDQVAKCLALLREIVPAKALQIEYGGERQLPYPVPPELEEAVAVEAEVGEAGNLIDAAAGAAETEAPMTDPRGPREEAAEAPPPAESKHRPPPAEWGFLSRCAFFVVATVVLYHLAFAALFLAALGVQALSLAALVA